MELTIISCIFRIEFLKLFISFYGNYNLQLSIFIHISYISYFINDINKYVKYFSFCIQFYLNIHNFVYKISIYQKILKNYC